MHFIRRVHTEASRSRAPTFKCNKNKIHVFSAHFFCCCFEYTPSNFNLQWSRLLFYFFLIRISFCFWFCRAFLLHCRRCYLLACCVNFVMAFFWDLFINWLHSDCFFMNNAINCDFQNKSNNNKSSSESVIGSSENRNARIAHWNRNHFVVHFHMTLWCDPLFFWCVWTFTLKSHTLQRSDAAFDRDVTTFTFNITKAGKVEKMHAHTSLFLETANKCHMHTNTHGT